MSTGYMFTIHSDGQIKPYAEFGNAWGMAPAVWDVLCAKYFRDSSFWLIARSEIQKLWDLHRDPRLSDPERAALLFTFDHATVAHNTREAVADLLEAFSPWVNLTHVNHLPAIASHLRSLPECVAACFQHTSVSENPWIGFNEEKDIAVPYDFTTSTKHFDIMESIRNFKSQQLERV